MEVLHNFLVKQLDHLSQKNYHIVCILFLCVSMLTISQTQIAGETADSLKEHNFSNNMLCLCNSTHMYCNMSDPPLNAVPSVIVDTVTHADFSNNAIQRIEKDDFAGSEILQKLNLANNSISYIHQNAFDNLYLLEILNLEHNQIGSIGLTFQHLISLRLLNLQNNVIKHINPHAFLSVAAASKYVWINLDNNTVHCDCETLALRNWQETLSVMVVNITMQCANDVQTSSYTDVEESIFGSCNSTLDDDAVISSVSECNICKNKKTNRNCNLQGVSRCSKAGAVCQKTVTWGAADRSLSITSQCSDYNNCLKSEANNINTCGLQYQTSRDVACNFCCTRNSCRSNTTEGRTKDFTFTLGYRGSLSLVAITDLQNIIVNEIKSAISSIQAGIDVDVHNITLENNQYYKAVLQLHLTTLGSDTENSVKESINKDLMKSIQTQNSFLNVQQPVDLVLSSYFEEMECNVSTTICPNEMNCIQGQDLVNRCLCNGSCFFAPFAMTCLLLDELEKTNLTVSSTADTVMLSWPAKTTHGATVRYKIQPFPDKGQEVVDSVSIQGANWSGLDPGTLYTFSVTSMVTNNFSNKTIDSASYEIWTKALHGHPCNPNATTNGHTCTGPKMECLFALSAEYLCLCSVGYYVFQGTTCRAVSELQVKDLNVQSNTSNTAILTWTAKKYGTNVGYGIITSPYTVQVVTDHLGFNGFICTGLEPVTHYKFTVMTILHGDKFYPERYVNSSEVEAWTKFAFGMQCDVKSKFALCATNMGCNKSLDSNFRCLCEDPSFYVTSTEQCLPSSLLEVRNTTASSTTDTITLSWTTDNYGANVFYSIQPSPYAGKMVDESLNGAIWSGLNSGTQYNFTVTSSLTHNYYTANAKVLITGLWTKAGHGDLCQFQETLYALTCSYNHLQCLPAHNEGRFCLCSSDYYFNPDNTCRNMSELQVKDLNVSSSTAQTMTLTFRAENHGTNVNYRILTSPYTVERTTHLNFSDVLFIDLEPGTEYNFTVITVLQADKFYQERYVNSPVLTAWTKMLENVTIFASYIRQNAVYQPFMADPSSQEYLIEEKRIITGVQSAISNDVDFVNILLDKFIPIERQLYKVLLQIEVTTYDTDLSEIAVNNAIQNNANYSKGFFFNEDLKSLEVSSNITGSYQCPHSVTSSVKGIFKWQASQPNVPWHQQCPFNNPINHSVPCAYRECQRNTQGFAEWSEVNDTLCAAKNIEDIFKNNITTANARIVSSQLKTYTESLDMFTVSLMDKTVHMLEQLAIEDILEQSDVVTNVMGCVSNLVNVNVKTLQESETENAASSRLLSVIDSVSYKAPIFGNQLMVPTLNIAIAAQKVDSGDTQNLTLVADTDSEQQKDKLVNIDLSTGNMPSFEENNKTSLMIPMEALLESLTAEEKNNLTRISFIVHRSDILFATIKNSEERRNSSKTTTTKNYDNENLPESNENPQKGSSTFVTKINSFVISASVPGIKVHNLKENITMSFEHIATNATNAQCVFWSESMQSSKGEWSSEGCGVVKSYARGTTCGCNHLTNFALLMDVYGEGSRLSDLDRKILSIISYIGCGISLLALILTLLTYILFRTLRRDNPSKILINLCLALLFSNLVFLVGMQDYSFNNIASCKAVAVLLHYFLLSSLTWMAVEAFYMYLALVLVFKTYFTNFLLKCSLVGWGVPLVIVIITLAVNKTDNYGFINSGLCWLKNPAFYAAFVGPVSFILLINCLAFILVVKQLISLSSNSLHKSDRSSTIQRLRGAVGVVILLGLAWLFAIFAIDEASLAFYYLFAIFNSLQGLFIFIFYCLLKKDAVLAVKRMLPCFEKYGDTSKSYTNSRGATNSAGHRLSEHKSRSSKFSGNTRSTNTTNTNSRKDSCFSNLSSNNTFDGAEIDGAHGYVEADTDSIINAAAALQPQENMASTEDIHSFPTFKSRNRNFENNNQDPDTNERCRVTSPERQRSSSSEFQSEQISYSILGTESLPASPPSPRCAPTLLNLSQTLNHDSEWIESSQNSSPDIDYNQTGSPTLSYKSNGIHHPSLTALTAEGENDYSPMDSVNNIKTKFELSNSQKSNQK